MDDERPSSGRGVLHGNTENEGLQSPLVLPVGSQEDASTAAAAAASSSRFQESVPKRIKLVETDPHILQGGKFEALSELKPLGLTLTKTPSFLNLLETMMSDETDSHCVTTETNTKRTRNRVRSNGSASQPISEKLKASNLSASLIQIGTWERASKFEGELVAKCYFAKRKLVWEILNGGLKNKIEIQWSDILGIRAVISDNEPGVLEVELNQPPTFFKETDPQPRKHTMWQPASDFTDDQATSCRRHKLIFPAGSLDKHYEKLLQCDSRLFQLSQRPFPSLNTPEFSFNLYSPNQFSFSPNKYEPGYAHQLQLPLPASSVTSWLPSYENHPFNPTLPPLNPSYPTPSFLHGAANLSHFSQNSYSIGVESPAMEYWGPRINNNANMVLPENRIQPLHATLPLTTQPVNNQSISCQHNQVLTYEQQGVNSREASSIINDLAQQLLSDSQDGFCNRNNMNTANPAHAAGTNRIECSQDRIADDPTSSSTGEHSYGQDGGVFAPYFRVFDPVSSQAPLDPPFVLGPSMEGFKTVNNGPEDQWTLDGSWDQENWSSEQWL